MRTTTHSSAHKLAHPPSRAAPKHPHPRQRSRGKIDFRDYRTWLPAAILLAIIGFAVALLLAGGVDIQRIRDWLIHLDPVLLVILMALLPLAGFPIGGVYLIAGAKFGPLVGSLVVTGTTAFHLVAFYWISRTVLRRPLEVLLKKRRYHLPEIPHGAEISFTVMGALVPGLPYFARNYALALSGINFRTYFLLCLPIYVIRSFVTIFVGDFGADPGTRQLVILGSVFAVKLAICYFLFRHLRKQFHGFGKARHGT